MLDPTRPDARAYAEKLSRGGVPVILREYETLMHGFGNLAHASPAARAALVEIGRLAGTMLRDPPVAQAATTSPPA